MNFLSRAACFSLFFYFCALSVRSANAQPVVINEIAWMGTETSYNDEWIELYNNTGSPINLSGWRLATQDGTPEINLTGNILAFSFYLLERTDDSTIPNIAADQIYVGPLGNAGEDLILYENTRNIVDKVSCASAGWFAGNNLTKQTMERIDSQPVGINPANWKDSQNPGGTPKAKNSVTTKTPPVQEESIEAEPEPELPLPENQSTAEPGEPEPKAELNPKPNEESAVQSNAIVYSDGIIINEILPSPAGADETEEWIEIFNQNQFEVDLSDWQIKDSSGAVTLFNFPPGTKISASGFLILPRPLTKITLNNDGDQISLLHPNGEVAETISYQKAKLGQSYSRLDSEWFWTDQLTPSAKNIITESASQIEKNEPAGNAAKENEELPIKEGLAAIGGQATKNNLFVLLVALVLAVLSAAIIFILKIKLKTS